MIHEPMLKMLIIYRERAVSLSSKNRKSSNKTEEVTCRVKYCLDKEGNRTKVKIQNYKTHLQRKHPEEDFNDKSGFSNLTQPKLVFPSHLERRDRS